jgi:2-C-methyl-D-erythritol 4-phosphate cytidylyltransferase
MVDKLIKNAKLVCIVPAAGKSTRFKNGNKLFDDNLTEDGHSVFTETLENLLLGVVDNVIVGYDEKCEGANQYKEAHSQIVLDNLTPESEKNTYSKIKFVKGGDSRQSTVFKALEYLKESMDDTKELWVMVHDAARPCILSYDILSFINKTIESNTSSIMAMPISDTIKKVDENFNVVETVSRDGMWVAQTPQMFKFHILHESLKHCIDNNILVTDESQALEILGHTCRVHIGRPYNIKITRNSDMWQAKCISNHLLDYIDEADFEDK